jgi:hypothetical protein
MALEEANIFAANKECPKILSAIDIFPPIASMLIDISHVHKFTCNLFQILFNIILSYGCPSSKWSPSYMCSDESPL